MVVIVIMMIVIVWMVMMVVVIMMLVSMMMGMSVIVMIFVIVIELFRYRRAGGLCKPDKVVLLCPADRDYPRPREKVLRKGVDPLARKNDVGARVDDVLDLGS